MKIKSISIIFLPVLALLFASCGNSATTTTNLDTTKKTISARINTTPVSETNTKSAPIEANINSSTSETPERKQVLNALRIPVSQELKQDIIFKVDHYKVEGDWAFVSASPKIKDGGSPNWKITKYQEYINNGDFEDGVYALLKKSIGKWTVTKYLMNCHDVCYLTWADDYKAPKSLFK